MKGLRKFRRGNSWALELNIHGKGRVRKQYQDEEMADRVLKEAEEAWLANIRYKPPPRPGEREVVQRNMRARLSFYKRNFFDVSSESLMGRVMQTLKAHTAIDTIWTVKQVGDWMGWIENGRVISGKLRMMTNRQVAYSYPGKNDSMPAFYRWNPDCPGLKEWLEENKQRHEIKEEGEIMVAKRVKKGSVKWYRKNIYCYHTDFGKLLFTLREHMGKTETCTTKDIAKWMDLPIQPFGRVVGISGSLRKLINVGVLHRTPKGMHSRVKYYWNQNCPGLLEWIAEHREEMKPQANYTDAYLATLDTGSRATIARALKVIGEIWKPEMSLGFIPWEQMKPEDVKIIHDLLTETYAPATANKMMVALCGVLQIALSPNRHQEIMEVAKIDDASGISFELLGSAAGSAEKARQKVGVQEFTHEEIGLGFQAEYLRVLTSNQKLRVLLDEIAVTNELKQKEIDQKDAEIKALKQKLSHRDRKINEMGDEIKQLVQERTQMQEEIRRLQAKLNEKALIKEPAKVVSIEGMRKQTEGT